MFHGLEEFDRPFFESYYLDQFLSDRLKLDSLGYVIDNISSDLFLLPKFKLDRQLYNKAITELNSSVTEKMFYTTIINALNDRLDFSPISNSLMSLRNLFDEELGNLSIPYIYSKEGYKEYISRNTGLLGKISSLAYHNQNLNLTRIKKSSDRAFSTYCNDYISYYKGLLSVIKFKKIYTIDEAISLLKCISNNSHIISNIFQQIDDVVIPNVKYRSIASDVSIIAANVPQTKLLNKEDLISEQMNNYFDEDMATNTLTPELKASLAKNIQELIDLFAKLSVAKDINESCFHEVVRLEKADSDSPLKQARETIALLSFPFDKLYRDLIINLESILYENAVNHINEQWGNLYPSLSQKIIQLYPFNIDNFLTQVSEKDFTSFFGKEGELNNFSDKYLGLEAISISDQGKYLIEFSKSVSSHWFNEDGKLQLKFTIIPLRLDPDIKEVTLLIAGNEFKFTHDHLDPCVVMWPDTKHNSNYSKIEFISNKGHHYGESFIGEWSWYKLLELDQKHTGDSNITFIGTSTNIIHSSLGEFEFELQFSQNTPLLDITKLQLVNYITHNPKK